MTVRPVKALGKMRDAILTKRQDALARQCDAQERKRIEHADLMKHALIVLESLRSWNLENGKSQA